MSKAEQGEAKTDLEKELEHLESGYSIEEIRAAFKKLWSVATGNSSDSLMSIPPRRGDVDFVLSGAIKELEKYRKHHEQS